MFKQLSIICGYLTLVAPNDIDIIEKEYCIAEEFSPSCASDEIIFMTYAHYGQMSLGRCLTVDRGDVGCQANVLQQFDAKCSGKQSCNVMVSDRTIKAEGGCGEGLLLYLKAGYRCIKEQVLKQCGENPDNKIKVNARDIYISSSNIKRSCANSGNELILEVENGQTMHICVVDLESSTLSDTVYGSVVDPANGKRIIFGNGPRLKPLLTSTSNHVHLSIQNPQKLFLLHIQVEGCQNMQPPPGAWTTRHGNTVEFGCHSGAKSWSLQCENNQWVGTVGQCGQLIEREDDINQERDTHVTSNDTSLSTDAALFGASSLVIFLSAIIFLIGVCVLKRKMSYTERHNPSLCRTIPDPYKCQDSRSEISVLQGVAVDNYAADNSDIDRTYINGSTLPDSSSVKYYVLESKK